MVTYEAIYREGIKNVLVTVIADLSMLEPDVFWIVLDHHSWVHPYDEDGRRVFVNGALKCGDPGAVRIVVAHGAPEPRTHLHVREEHLGFQTILVLLGDIFDIAFEENVMNMRILMKYRNRRLPPRSFSQIAGVLTAEGGRFRCRSRRSDRQHGPGKECGDGGHLC